MNLIRSVSVCSFVGFVFIAIGCGSQPPTATVSGAVKIGGTDVDGGRIRFIPATGLPVEGDIKAGRYTVANVPVGEVKVAISWVKPTGKQRELYGPGSEKTDIKEEVIPAIYNNNTELRFTVTAGANTKDFLDLKKSK